MYESLDNDLFNITYKKNLGKNYMNIEADVSLWEAGQDIPTFNEDFRIKMITENHIAGLLDMHIQYVNGIPTFCYNISGLQSLSVILENHPLNDLLFNRLFTGIYNAMTSCEHYMLDCDKLLFSEEHIFLSSDLTEIQLCYFPLKNSSFSHSFKKLSDYLLKKVDHTDEHAVFMAYSMHKSCYDENFTINTICSYISSAPSDDYVSKTVVKETPPAEDLPPFTPLPASLPTTTMTYERTFLLKVFALASVCTAGLIGSIAVYLFKIINTNLFLIILTGLIIFAAYNGYNLYRQRSKSDFPALEADVSENVPDININDTGSTVLLSSPENYDFHSLIYTGTDSVSEIKLTHYPFTIGKNDSCDAILPNPMISRLHARISCVPDENASMKYYITDLNSTNGTYLNGTSLSPYEIHPINPGDHISFGHLTYIFQ